MTITLQASDALEYFHDTDYELLGNQGRYGVFSGCAVTYDASDLTVDVAAGTVLHNGSVVQVAAQADAVTLVADGSNKRWSYIAVNSSGTVVLVSGDAAADSSTEPTKPELGDYVLLSMVKIEDAQTVANDIAVKLDKRVMLPSITVIKQSDESVSSSTALQNDDELVCYLDASTKYAFEAMIGYVSDATPDYKNAFTVPSGATIVWTAMYTNASSTLAIGHVAASGSGLSCLGATTAQGIQISGYVVVDSTAGALTYQFAQNSSDATAATTKAGSWLRVMRC